MRTHQADGAFGNVEHVLTDRSGWTVSPSRRSSRGRSPDLTPCVTTPELGQENGPPGDSCLGVRAPPSIEAGPPRQTWDLYGFGGKGRAVNESVRGRPSAKMTLAGHAWLLIGRGASFGSPPPPRARFSKSHIAVFPTMEMGRAASPFQSPPQLLCPPTRRSDRCGWMVEQ